jgi:Tfp pilus assembly PilM family ATPase
MNSASIYLEIGQSSLKALGGEEGLELPLERQANGRLTKACKETLGLSLKAFLKQRKWQSRTRVFCAIGARGVSLRRLTLPASTKENLHRLLLLQIETEFPLPPDELAWGYRQLSGPGSASVTSATQELLIVAVKKEVVEEYTEILSGCGVTAVFTLAALERSALCPRLPSTYGILDIGQNHSELILFEQGVPTAVRLLSWGGENITQAIQQSLGTTRDLAEKLKLSVIQGSLADGELGQTQGAMDNALDSLAAAIDGNWTGKKLYLTGRSARYKEIASQLAKRLDRGVECEPLELPPGQGRSAAILGLRNSVEKGGSPAPLVLEVQRSNGNGSVARPAPWKWAALAVLLGLGLLSLPYLEAVTLKPRLAKKLAVIKADRGRLPIIDNEWNFLQYLKLNQPPYLDTLFLLAKAAPPQAKIESINMNRRGDLSWRGSMKDSQQVTDFRTKLIDSGLFSNVTVEEQAPTPDRQKVNVRMSAHWKPVLARQSLALGPTAEEIGKAKTRVRDQPGMMPGMPMGMPPGMPMGMPPGISMPGMPSMDGMPGRMPSSRRVTTRMTMPPGQSGGPMPAMPNMPEGTVIKVEPTPPQ